MNNQKGMTLIELIIVVVIMGLMFVLSTTFLTTTTSHAKVKSAARDVATELQMARMKAIYRNREYQVKLTLTAGTTTEDKYIFERCTVGGGACTLSGGGGIDSWETDPERLNMVASADVKIPLAVDVTKTDCSSGTHKIEFNPDGTSPAGTDGLCFINRDNRDDRIRLTVSPSTGRVKLETNSLCSCP